MRTTEKTGASRAARRRVIRVIIVADLTAIVTIVAVGLVVQAPLSGIGLACVVTAAVARSLLHLVTHGSDDGPDDGAAGEEAGEAGEATQTTAA